MLTAFLSQSTHSHNRFRHPYALIFQTNHKPATMHLLLLNFITTFFLQFFSLVLLSIKVSMSLLPVTRSGYRFPQVVCPLCHLWIVNVALTWVTLPLVHGAKHSETGGERVEGISSGKEFWAGEGGDSFSSLWLLTDKKQRGRIRHCTNVSKNALIYMSESTVYLSAKYVWTCKCIYPAIGRHNDKHCEWLWFT